jgi:hypothetical protein
MSFSVWVRMNDLCTGQRPIRPGRLWVSLFGGLPPASLGKVKNIHDGELGLVGKSG